MRYAIIIREGKEEHALLKTDTKDRAIALALLCREHLASVMPKAECWLSSDLPCNIQTGMHPDKDFIMGKLREAEFPLPGNNIIIEGELA